MSMVLDVQLLYMAYIINQGDILRQFERSAVCHCLRIAYCTDEDE